MQPPLPLSYIVPVRYWAITDLTEFAAYLRELHPWVAEIIVVDGSRSDIFEANARALTASAARHIPVDADQQTLNGKVGGVLTGVRQAAEERLVIADDDVRYSRSSLEHLHGLLDHAEIVRPQNYFRSWPWHASWDTARSLINRVTGGDWPGTLGVSRSALLRAGGYDGDVLFENLELVRTIRASGGRELVAYDCYVARDPPAPSRFWKQRVRQAYDEFARPIRMGAFAAALPLLIAALLARRLRFVMMVALGSAVVAEFGRRRAGGRSVFPVSTTLYAPLWLVERAICTWIAIWLRVRDGGVRYSDAKLAKAASSYSQLHRRLR